MAVDVLFVGGGPAGLAGALALAGMAAQEADRAGVARPEIAVLEKGAGIGDHCLSGAVLNPAPFRELFPGISAGELPLRGEVAGERFYYLSARGRVRLPVPPTMHNTGCRFASICEVVRWLGSKAEALGVNILTGYPADALLEIGGRVVGVRTAASGLARDGTPGAAYQEPTEIHAKVTVLCEGARGPLSQAYLTAKGVRSPNPQMYALGVKELWRVRSPLREVVHTMGWPVPAGTFGGGWLYPMSEDRVSLGLVVGLDSPDAELDPHELVQRFKLHPVVREMLRGGELIEWGAKVIPEGGYHAIPERLGGDGLLIAGDAAGLVDVASLKGIHLAMRSGIAAARAAWKAVASGDSSWGTLSSYDREIREGPVGKELWRTRNMRLGFKRGLVWGGLMAGAASVTGGRVPRGRIVVRADADEPKRIGRARERLTPDGKLTFSKLDANFKSGNSTRDDVPLHVLAGADVPAAVGKMYERLCPAGVYEWRDGALIVNAPNCIDCRATDVLGPRWTVREGGSGARYRQM